jgi:hypothetical protein
VNVVDLEHVAMSGLVLRHGPWFRELAAAIAAELNGDNPLAEVPLWAMESIDAELPAIIPSIIDICANLRNRGQLKTSEIQIPVAIRGTRKRRAGEQLTWPSGTTRDGTWRKRPRITIRIPRASDELTAHSVYTGPNLLWSSRSGGGRRP